MTFHRRPLFGAPRPKISIVSRDPTLAAVLVHNLDPVSNVLESSALDHTVDKVEENLIPVLKEELKAENPDSPLVSGHARTPPVYAGEVRVADYSTKPLSGMNALLILIDADPSLPNPFKGMKVGRSSAGNRIHLVISKPQPESEDLTLYVGEGILNWWSEDPARGMTATIRFDEGPDGAAVHPLHGIEPSPKNGEIVFFACWAVADDEKVVHPVAARKAVPRPFNQSDAVRQSNMRCQRDSEFREFCRVEIAQLLPRETISEFPDFDASPTQYAASVVRAFCGIASRAEFGHDTPTGYEARNRWSEIMRRFDDWQRGWRVVKSRN